RPAGLADVALLADVGLGYGAAEVRVLPPAPPGPNATGLTGGTGPIGGTGADDEDWHPASRRELDRFRRAPDRRGVTVFLTGLSGSGKSTIARGLAERLLDDGRREISLLDGDEVRRLLSHGLGFSRADRDLNIRRIGFVAAEITRHGGLAICAPIAPFEQVRREVRERVEEVGDFVLVHVSTPLAECERRDRKGLYARARQGLVAEFTGISSPYEAPEDADLRVDTTGIGEDEAVDRVWQLLLSRGYLGTSVDPAG
ncbi:MAG TPA: adenylyl-sulfate kinase, partial [Kineosporiaceae bacterium]|nr:adenylyl-sulfate kinase [Kineosporiaceae bacterium]